jgi:hypothetical protein
MVASLLGLMAVLAAPVGQAVPLTVYGELPNIEDVAISPDGSRLAYVRTQGDMRVVFIADVANRKIIRWVKAGETKLRGISWADPDNLMIMASVTTAAYGFRQEWFMLRDYNIPRLPVRVTPSCSRTTAVPTSMSISSRLALLSGAVRCRRTCPMASAIWPNRGS